MLVVFLSATGWMGIREYQSRQRILGAATQKQKQVRQLKQEIESWQKIASASPTYRDAYIQLAIGYWQLAATNEARQNLQRVLELDPNWVVPPQLESLLRLLP